VPLPQSLPIGEEPPVGSVEIRERLLERYRRHLSEPGTLRGLLHGGQQDRQVRVGDVRQAAVVRLAAGTQPVVVHDPDAAEQPGKGHLLAGCGVEAVVVPEPHPYSILGLMARYQDIRAGR
jgi:hypothetical protein